MKRPNILVFMTDQQRADSLSQAKMPNLLRFCSEGLTFTNAFTVAPHCCPSRATFFSGLYPSQHGVWNNVLVNNTLSPCPYEGIRLFTEDLHESGYQMYFSGKWHVSALESPLDRGFDEFDEPIKKAGKKSHYMTNKTEKQVYRHIQPATTNWDLYQGFQQRSLQERKEGEIIRHGYPPFCLYGEDEDIFQDKDVVNCALNRLAELNTNGQPWFYYIGTLGPHDPYYAPQKYLDLYRLEDIQLPANFHDSMKDKPGLYRRVQSRFRQLSEQEHREALRHYLAFCSYQDDLFGQILDSIEQRGETDNTLIIYISDHGDYGGEHGLWCKGLPCFDGAYRIPLVMRWPKGIQAPGRDVHEFVTLADFAPFFEEVAGLSPKRQFTGRSLLPLFQKERPVSWVNERYTQTNGNELYGIQRSVSTKKWKYVYNGFDYDELYDLELDPGETKNLASDPQFDEIKKELYQKIWRFARKTDDVCVHPYIFCSIADYGPGIISNE